MHPTKAGHGRTRFVATCQQLLVLGAVFAALIPAASVVNLDVVGRTPQRGGAPAPTGVMAAYVRAATTPSRVPTSSVQAKVHEIRLTSAQSVGGYGGSGPVGRAIVGAPVTRSATEARPGGRTATAVVTSDPQPVTGYGVVGVTWSAADTLSSGDATFQLRTQKDGAWTGWKAMDLDADGPDGDSAEGRGTRPGTMEALVGHVDQVQVRMTVTGGAAVPEDLTLAVIDPGEPASTAVERPAIDTGRIDEGASAAPATTSDEPVAATTGAPATGGGEAQAVLAAAAYTPKPQIYSRAQWGANEKVREQTAPSYDEVHGGFVHHTVNSNNYTAAEVPAIIRSIYAYHVQARGWRDIGYNFLIDKFGRIWEGRYGGIDRPVVGAHTENYNDWSFGASAIGNYDIAQPSAALIQAYGALFAWKLALHGVSASARNVRIGPKVFSSSIMGHRDTKATACPGRYLYAKIPQIRTIAASLQRGWANRGLESNLASTTYPDLIVRRASDKRVFLVPTNGLAGFRAGRAAATVSSGTKAVPTPDVTGDKRSDLVQVAPDGTVRIQPGAGTTFGRVARTLPRKLAGHDLTAAAGDLNGDGHNDLVSRDRASRRIDVYLGDGHGGFRVRHSTVRVTRSNRLVGPGDLTGDHRPDLLSGRRGVLWLYPGLGNGGFGPGRKIAGSWATYDSIVGGGDLTGDGRPDLFVRAASSKQGYILPLVGSGRFGRAIGPFPRTRSGGPIIAATQLVGNGLPDLVARTGARLSVYANNGHTQLMPTIATNLVLPTATQIIDAGDWNRDGRGDLIARTTSGDLMLYAGWGNGQFTAARKIGSGFGSVSLLTAVGDVTGDGWPDLQGRSGRYMWIWPGAGTGALRAPYVSHSSITATQQVNVGLWDGDGAPDSLFVVNGRAVVYPGNGPGGLTTGHTLSTSLAAYDRIVGVSDLQGGAKADLLVRRRGTGDLYVLPGDGSGFAAPIYLGSGLEGFDLWG